MKSSLVAALAAIAVTLISSASYADPLEERLTAGDQAFKAENYALALTEFERALAIADIPVVRFNIARTNEALGHCELAKSQYEDLRDAEEYDPDIAEVVLARLEAIPCATRPEPTPSTPPTPEPKAERSKESIRSLAYEEEVRRSEERKRSNPLAIIGWTTLGVGAVGTTAMLVEHLENHGRIRDGYDRIAATHGCTYDSGSDTFTGSSCDSAGATADSRYEAFEADVKTARTRAAVVFPITGGVMAVGAGLLVYSALRRERPVAIIPWGGAGAAGVSTMIGF